MNSTTSLPVSTERRRGPRRAPGVGSALLIAGVALLLIPADALSQVQFVNASSGQSGTTTTSFSFSHTVSAGTDKILIVGAEIRSSADSFTSVTYNGVALTKISGITGASDVRAELWYLINPPVGTFSATLNASASRNLAGGAMSFTGVHQTAPVGTYAQTGGQGNATSVNVSSAPGEMVVDVVAQRDPGTLETLTVGPLQTEQYRRDHTNTAMRIAGSTEPGASTVTMSWAFTGDPRYAQVAVPLKPSSVAPPATLLGRYWLREAPSGQTPTTVADDQASPLNLSVTFTPQVAWARRNGHRGLQSTSSTHAGVALASAVGTKYPTQLDNVSRATFAVVASWVDSADSQGMAGFEGTGASPAMFGTSATGDITFGVSTKAQANIRVYWTPVWDDDVRRVFHLVYDSDNATANRRIRLYMNGVDQGVGTLQAGSWPALGERLDFAVAGLNLYVLNRSSLAQALEGTAYYYAVYLGALTDAEIAANASALLADDDNLSLSVSVTPDGVDTVARLPSNGVEYSQRYTVTNTSGVWADFDLFGFPGVPAPTFLTVDSVRGPNLTYGAPPDSARLGVLAPGASDSAFVWHRVGSAANGALDSLYLRGRSVDNAGVSDNGRAFVRVAKPVMTTSKAVNPSGTQPPGTDLTYTATITNTGSAVAVTTVIVDTLPAQVDFKVGSVVNNLPVGISVAVEYSNDGGSTWTYVPASGACAAPAGYDRCVNRIRWRLLNDLSSVPPDNTGTLEFVARIR